MTRSAVGPWMTAVLLAAVVAIQATPAAAHSFLATTRPAQGERLAGPPREVALQLSEPVEHDSARVEVSDTEGRPVEVGRVELDSGGAIVRLPLVSPGAGLYRVSWHVVSAVDGHESAGEFAFAVGDEAALGAVATTDSPGEGSSVLVTVATWFLLAGWSIAFGAAALAQRAGRVAFPGHPRSWIRGGALAALAGLGVRAAAGFGQRAMAVTIIAGLAIAAAMALANARRPWPALAGLAAFAAVWPARGHAAVTPLGWALDTVHLAAAGVWVGGLSVVLVGLYGARRAGNIGDVVPLARLYAGTAWVAVLALVVTGVALALTLVPDVAALVTDPYGRLVALKATLLLAALVGAVVARRRLARPDLDGVRRATRPEHLALAIALVVAAVLVDTPPAPAETFETLLGPPPITGPVARTAGMAGQITLDVQAGDGRLDVNARGPSGGIDADLTLSALLPDGTEVELHPRPCGVGCATIAFELPSGESTIVASAQAADWTGGATTLELRWPPTDEQPSLFARMRQAMLEAGELEVVEAADVDPELGAPGSPLTGARLVELMPWAGGGVSDVRPVSGDPGRFTFYLPGSFMWFDVTVDEHGRLRYQRLVNPGHDIRYRFRYPNQPDPVAPPTP